MTILSKMLTTGSPNLTYAPLTRPNHPLPDRPKPHLPFTPAPVRVPKQAHRQCPPFEMTIDKHNTKFSHSFALDHTIVFFVKKGLRVKPEVRIRSSDLS